MLGVAYKKNVDDDRESPAHEIIARLGQAGFDVAAHDPHVAPSAGVSRDLPGTLDGAGCVLLVTGHDAYRDLALDDAGLTNRLLIDTCGLWRERAPELADYEYVLLGAGRG